MINIHIYFAKFELITSIIAKNVCGSSRTHTFITGEVTDLLGHGNIAWQFWNLFLV